MNKKLQIEKLNADWQKNPRWKNIVRGYSAEDVVNLMGTVNIECTLARIGSEKLWNLINQDKPCLLYTSPSPRDGLLSRMPSSA